MKNQIITLIGCAMALSPLSAEDSPASGKRPEGRPDGSFFKSLDTNDDKAISKEEAGERWERLGKLDKDGDGKVALAEMAALMPEGGRPGAARPAEGGPGAADGKGGLGFLSRADKNGDGDIAKDELPAEMWERLSRLDKNSDSVISKDEAKLMGGPGGGPGAPDGKGTPDGPGCKGGAEMFARADKNGDGQLGKDELPAEAWERMGKLDKNSDDVISKEELAGAMRERIGQGPGRPEGMAGKGGPGEGGPGAMFSRFDTDKDGKLSKSEVPAEMWDKLSNADDDADGLISKGELEKVYGARDGGGPGPEKKPEGTLPPEKSPGKTPEADNTAV